MTILGCVKKVVKKLPFVKSSHKSWGQKCPPPRIPPRLDTLPSSPVTTCAAPDWTKSAGWTPAAALVVVVTSGAIVSSPQSREANQALSAPRKTWRRIAGGGYGDGYTLLLCALDASVLSPRASSSINSCIQREACDRQIQRYKGEEESERVTGFSIMTEPPAARIILLFSYWQAGGKLWRT